MGREKSLSPDLRRCCIDKHVVVATSGCFFSFFLLFSWLFQLKRRNAKKQKQKVKSKIGF
jgi:hypothetical protein